ncbi:MAG TPA: hypothetical protein VLG47_02845 [Candidatus Saccharimonadales bacterium]|nr:hypothetical protein [Candidatus Saccharimonadales bacterium]
MLTKKSRRWQFILLASFFITLQFAAVFFAAKPASADITKELSGCYRVVETITFKKGSTIPKFDTITGDQGVVANLKSQTTSGNTVTAHYQSADQCTSWNATVPPPQYSEASTLLSPKKFTCIPSPARTSGCGANGAATTTDPGGGGGGDTKTTPSCETSGGGPLDWLICGIFNTLADVSNTIFKVLIIPLLREPPIPISDSGDNKVIFEVWSNFRIYADIFLVIALVVVVFMQAITGGTAEVYTAKKALPKLLAAVILVNLSIYIVALMVDATNIVGAGVANIILGPLSNSSNNLAIHPGAGSGALFTGSAIVGGAALFTALSTATAGLGAIAVSAIPFILLNAIMPLIIGLIIAFLVLALRQALIILLVLVSPIAFALWFLPNTESVFNRWWKLFFELLMVYPIAVAIFTVFNLVAVIFGS